jgi:hypothetical protein
MFRNVLETIAGIEIYPVISLLMFFTLFGSVLVWFFRADKIRLEQISRLPLEENPPVIRG